LPRESCMATKPNSSGEGPGSLSAAPFPVVISAPSGTGKTTIINRLVSLDDSLEHVISTTTRQPRQGEREGVDYYFVSDEAFSDMVDRGLFLEWAVVFGDRYGTSRAALDFILRKGKTPVMDLDCQGAARMREVYPGCITIFIAPPSLDALRERLISRRTEAEEELAVRLKTAIMEIRRIPEYEYLVVNDNLDRTISQIQCIIRAEKSRLEFIPEAELNRWIEHIVKANFNV